MEHISKEDLNAIHSIIEEFEGDTVIGKHMFKAIKAYFKQKEVKVIPKVVYAEYEQKQATSELISKNAFNNIIKKADDVLYKNFLKISKKGKLNGNAKGKKKAN